MGSLRWHFRRSIVAGNFAVDELPEAGRSRIAESKSYFNACVTVLGFGADWLFRGAPYLASSRMSWRSSGRAQLAIAGAVDGVRSGQRARGGIVGGVSVRHRCSSWRLKGLENLGLVDAAGGVARAPMRPGSAESVFAAAGASALRVETC